MKIVWCFVRAYLTSALLCVVFHSCVKNACSIPSDANRQAIGAINNTRRYFDPVIEKYNASDMSVRRAVMPSGFSMSTKMNEKTAPPVKAPNDSIAYILPPVAMPHRARFTAGGKKYPTGKLTGSDIRNAIQHSAEKE